MGGKEERRRKRGNERKKGESEGKKTMRKDRGRKREV